MTSWSFEKQTLLASQDVIISSQSCGSNHRGFFTIGDGYWLPWNLTYQVERQEDDNLMDHLGLAQLLCITDGKKKTSFEVPPRMALCNQKCHFQFSPGLAETFVFVDFVWSHKKYHFPKLIVSTKMRVFLLSEHKSCLPISLRNAILAKTVFVHNHPQILF